MKAAYAEKFGLADPVDGVVVGERPEPTPPPGWEVVTVKAAALNHHDIWLLRGVIRGIEPPVILGCDGAGVTEDGREVVLHAVLGERDEFRLLSDGVDGTFALRVAVPSRNLLPKPAGLSWEEASCLPTAWLTAWSMLFTKGRLLPGERVLVQGATGGVATAAVILASKAGVHVTVTSRSAEGLERARRIGAHDAVPSGTRLSEPVDVVIDTVGTATWEHSVRSLGFRGRLVTAGATTGSEAVIDLRRVYWPEIEILGAKMGSIDELRALCHAVERLGIRPPISKVYEGVEAAPIALRDLAASRQFGKLVLRIS